MCINKLNTVKQCYENTNILYFNASKQGKDLKSLRMIEAYIKFALNAILIFSFSFVDECLIILLNSNYKSIIVLIAWLMVL